MIKEIQKKIGVIADGIVGPKTLDAAKKALANGTITNEEMYELSGDHSKPNPEISIPDETPQTKRISFLDVANASKPDSNNVPFSDKPTYTVPFLNPTSFNKDETPTWEQVLKTGYGKDSNTVGTDSNPPETDSKPDRTYKSGIMALLNPTDKPEYLGSKLYLKNERENYAKAIGGTPVISKVFQGIDYSNSDVKDLMDSAMDDVKTQEAMKNYQEERQKGAMDNIRAMANQYQDAAASIRQNIDVSAQQNKEIDAEIARLQSIADDKK